MRVAPLVKATAIALACCCGAGCSPNPTPSPTQTPAPTPTPPPTPITSASDVTIDIHLYRQPDPPRRCVVAFDNPDTKRAVAYTGYQVIWRVTQNECGDVKKGALKALGLKFIRHQHGGPPAKWRDQCTTLPFVPAVFDTPPQVVCFVSSATEGDVEGEYEYELNGDSVDPVDPDLDVRPGR
jgi:hypothetical protein